MQSRQYLWRLIPAIAANTGGAVRPIRWHRSVNAFPVVPSSSAISVGRYGAEEPSQQAHPQLHRLLRRPSSRTLSSRTPPSGPAGQPAITKNTSKTKSPMAMSLKSDAWGRVDQSWFAAQKRKAAANRMVLSSSARGPKQRGPKPRGPELRGPELREREPRGCANLKTR